MKLSVSNIAWAPEDRDVAYALLRDHGITGLEIAPGLLFHDTPSPMTATAETCAQAVKQAAQFGLHFSSMQSLLFGAENAALFAGPDARDTLQNTMQSAISLAARLGLSNLVFGSPKNRVIPEDMSETQARAIWQKSFLYMGDCARAANVIIALEPNPKSYGTNFMTSIAETLAVVKDLDHPAIRMNLDLGAIIMTDEIATLESWLPEALSTINHVHLSTPNLAPLDTHAPAVQRLLQALQVEGWNGWVSIEMRRDLEALPKAISICINWE